MPDANAPTDKNLITFSKYMGHETGRKETKYRHAWDSTQQTTHHTSCAHRLCGHRGCDMTWGMVVPVWWGVFGVLNSLPALIVHSLGDGEREGSHIERRE